MLELRLTDSKAESRVNYVRTRQGSKVLNQLLCQTPDSEILRNLDDASQPFIGFSGQEHHAFYKVCGKRVKHLLQYERKQSAPRAGLLLIALLTIWTELQRFIVK